MPKIYPRISSERRHEAIYLLHKNGFSTCEIWRITTLPRKVIELMIAKVESENADIS